MKTYDWCYPHNLDIATFLGTWYVANVRNGKEKSFADTLKARQTNYFLPIESHRDKHRNLVERPLYPGYLFFQGDQTTRYDMMFVGPVGKKRLWAILDAKDQDGLKRDLDKMLKLLQSGQRIDTSEYLEVGRLCRVASGSFMGLEGRVTQKLDNDRMAVGVEMMGRVVDLDVARDMLESVA